MKLFLKEHEAKLEKQGRELFGQPEKLHRHHKPVVKIFGGPATWLISAVDPDDPDMLFGLCDLGVGFPELGYVLRSQLESMTMPPFGLKLERDRYWKPKMTLLEYADEATRVGAIRAY